MTWSSTTAAGIDGPASGPQSARTIGAPWFHSWFHVERIWADLRAPETSCYVAAGLGEVVRGIS